MVNTTRTRRMSGFQGAGGLDPESTARRTGAASGEGIADFSHFGSRRRPLRSTEGGESLRHLESWSMKPATYRLVGVHADGWRVIVFEASTREAVELDLRLIQHSSPYAEMRIEGGPAVREKATAERPKNRPDAQPAPISFGTGFRLPEASTSSTNWLKRSSFVSDMQPQGLSVMMTSSRD
jgi:hypothetical protein